MLLRPFCVEELTIAEVSSLLELITRYGQTWTMELLATWSGSGSAGLALRRVGAAPVGRGLAAERVRAVCDAAGGGRHGGRAAPA